MKYFYSLFFTLLLPFFAFAQNQTVTYSISPASFNETQSVTLTFNGSSINESTWGGTPGMALYLWAWSFDQNDLNSQDSPNNGTWASSSEASKLTYNSANDTYSITVIPKDYFNRTGIGKIGFLIKTKTGSGQSQDFSSEVVQLFNFNLTSPAANSYVSATPGNTVNITATSSVPVTFNLYANDTLVNTVTSATSYSYAYTVTGDAVMRLTATNSDNQTLSQSFNIVANRTVTSAAIPSWIRPGINYTADATKIGLALYAPQKTFVHVIGSFNNWTRDDAYLMKRDTTNPDLYWIEISGLTAQQIYTFQYLTNDNIRVADPFSPLVLSPDDDPWIEAADYPNLPVYPAGQRFDVSVIQTGMPEYNWTVQNFNKPAKENLIVYELLVRDFTSEKNWQSLIDKIPYLKSLNINAVELMPIMEFDGNNSWGYNTSFHYALDKAYGTKDKFKEFVDKCHQNGIAVILDIALNHASGRNPLVRLWATDPDGDGYGQPTASNPYFNQTAKHAYSVFEDFNHSSPHTRYYVERVVEQWIKEYKIDGYRWDLTKGFTQNCTSGDEGCTGSYQQDRVDVLKLYADKQWSYDASSYVIFEHLGGDQEEKEWANYRINEGKGVMMWTNLNWAYSQNAIGDANSSNFNRADYELHGFTERRALAYAESHDEERMMYRMLNFGKSNGSYDVKNLATALDRQEAVGAILFTVPGPKMIWQFGELGYEFSINRCENGSISNDCRTNPKPVAFALNYHNDANRKAVYDTWSKIIALRQNNPVFDTKTFTIDSGDLTPNIYIWRDDLATSTLKNVVVIANFELTAQTIKPNFPYVGTWYNLLDNSSITVTDPVFDTVTLQPGEFRIFGNQKSASTESYTISTKQASCSANNGEITITVNKPADYTARLTGPDGYSQTFTFNSTKVITNLTAGTYRICIAQAGGAETCSDITIAKETVAAPTGTATQTVLPGFSLADLSVAGTAVKWYATATGGTALPANTVLENGKTYYASQTVNGCESTQRLAVKTTVDFNNFNVESRSETCAGKNNGEIVITANQSFAYVAKINGTSYSFTNNKLTVSNLAPGTYPVCITIPGKTFEQCYTLTIAKGANLTGKIATNSTAVSVNIMEGTAPFKVLINGIERMETNDNTFVVPASQGDLVEIKTAVSCEGSLTKLITEPIAFGAAAAYPNPTKGLVNVSLPFADREVGVEVYSQDGRLLFSQKMTVANGSVSFDLSKYPQGVYIAKILMKQPVSIRIIKN